MLTKEEVLEKIYNSKETFIKLLLKTKIIKIDGFKQNSLDPREVWVTFKFNYRNPLTYIHFLFMSIINIPTVFDEGIRTVWRDGKKELTDGFGLWVY